MPISSRLAPFGQTIFTTMTKLAVDHGAVNLGQGFPDFDGPEFVKEAAGAAIAAGHGQYARSAGITELVEEIAGGFTRLTGLTVDPLENVTVTSGCTEALAATFLGLIEPGTEVVLIEPTYDAYRPDAALAGAIPRFVTLRPPDFALDEAALRAAMSPRTAAVVVNTPHNPSGRVFSRRELELVAELCQEYDSLAIADEVYEHMVFDGVHTSLAGLDGMWQRTVTLSSLGKSFSLTGWKIGWAVAPEELTRGVRAAHQFLTFATATPLQHAAVAALAAPPDYYAELVDFYRKRRDLLAEGLDEIGFEVYLPQGTYFMLADHTAFGTESDVEFVERLIVDHGVAAIPPSAFYHRPEDGSSLVRFAFCKEEETLREALRRLDGLRG